MNKRKRRVCGAIVRTSGIENDAKSDVRRAQHGFGFQAASVNQNSEEIRERCETKTENEAGKEVCVTRSEEVGDV